MEVPVLAEELKRKVLEAMTKAYLDYKAGKVTEAEAKYALDIMWMAVAGLVDNDFKLMIENFDAELSYHNDVLWERGGIDQSYMKTELHQNRAGVFALIRTINGTGDLQVMRFEGQPKVNVYSFEDKDDPDQARLQLLQQLRKVFSS